MSFILKYWKTGAILLLAIAVIGAVVSIRNAYAEREKLKIEAQAREDYIEDLQAQQAALIKSQKTKVKNEQIAKGKSHDELVNLLDDGQWLRVD